MNKGTDRGMDLEVFRKTVFLDKHILLLAVVINRDMRSEGIGIFVVDALDIRKSNTLCEFRNLRQSVEIFPEILGRLSFWTVQADSAPVKKPYNTAARNRNI